MATTTTTTSAGPKKGKEKKKENNSVRKNKEEGQEATLRPDMLRGWTKIASQAARTCPTVAPEPEPSTQLLDLPWELIRIVGDAAGPRSALLLFSVMLLDRRYASAFGRDIRGRWGALEVARSVVMESSWIRREGGGCSYCGCSDWERAIWRLALSRCEWCGRGGDEYVCCLRSDAYKTGYPRVRAVACLWCAGRSVLCRCGEPTTVHAYRLSWKRRWRPPYVAVKCARAAPDNCGFLLRIADV
jgi:hypothetical protein